MLRIAFVPGVTPDKWLRIWGERSPEPIEAQMVEQTEQLTVLRDGTVDMCFVRLPVDKDGLHVIPLYHEVSVAVLAKENPLTVLDELTLDDLKDEPLVDLAAMPTRYAIEVVASGTGHVIVPMSVARLHHRKDVVARSVTDEPQTRIGLAWRADNEDPRLEQFIGVVRGRTERSSRVEPTPPVVRKPAPAKKAPPRKAAPAKKAAPKRPGPRKRR